MKNSNSKQPSPPKSYHFVMDQEPGCSSQIRRHVAKERWRKRKASNRARFQRTTPRTLVPMLPSILTSTIFQNESDYKYDDSNSDTSHAKSIEQRRCVRKEHNNLIASSISGFLSRIPSPYQSLGQAELDPFNGICLSREDQSLLHHCESTTH